MREIKFRAWDGKLMMHFELGSLWAGDMFDADWQIMQFTGLLDKNGKEIYEGDIIRDDCWTLSEWEVYFGIYNEDDYDTSPGYGWGLRQRNGATRTITTCGSPDDTRHYEIIGNIYENQGLIK